jgi:hypothetical protein
MAKICSCNQIVYWFSKLMKETLGENLRLQNEVFQEKEQGLQNQLAFRNRELTFQAVMIAKSSEAIKNTKKSLRVITNSNTKENSNTLIDKLIYDLGIYENSEIWNNFQDRFVQVHPDFVNRFPNLSPAEQKLASFLKLGLSSKEVALLTSNEKNSVDVARSRLRKKLGLSRMDNLNEFLNQF